MIPTMTPLPAWMFSYAETLERAYERWWNPCLIPPPPPLPRSVRPHCGVWVPLQAPIPKTARWALVHIGEGRIRYAKTQATAISMCEDVALGDHPHVYLVPVRVGETATLDALLARHRRVPPARWLLARIAQGEQP